MLVTKHAAELFALLVSDMYGELPSRILSSLLSRGRSTIPQLARHTALSPTHIKHGLVVLIQQNLLYHHTAKDSPVTWYEAKPEACYNLLRVGKVVRVIAEQHGPAEVDVAQSLLLRGHARISDLERSVRAGGDKAAAAAAAKNGVDAGHSSEPLGSIRSIPHLHQTLYNLLRADLLDVIGPRSFQNGDDIYNDIEEALGGQLDSARGGKSKAEREKQLAERFREAQQEGKRLKRQLDPGPHYPVKRRRLANGHADHESPVEPDNDGGPLLDPNAIIRINVDKCLVELRNQCLAKFATDSCGEVAGHIYHTLLRLLTAGLPSCGTTEDLGTDSAHQPKATTLEILRELDPSVDVFDGIGEAGTLQIDSVSAERVRGPPGPDGSDSEDSDDGWSVAHGQGDDGDDGEDEVNGDDPGQKPNVNGNGPTAAEFQGNSEPKNERAAEVRRHLLVLSESKAPFVRLCGRQGNGQWTVDFGPLLERLREAEVDAVIEQRYGRHGLRLTRILREKGKMDERALPNVALIKKSDVQAKLLVMQKAGIVDVQEVPKDSSRSANRTMFFWYFDGDRCRAQFLDVLYKSMVRCLERLEVERHRNQAVLSFVARKDIRGREEELMAPDAYKKYQKHLVLEGRLLGQVMSLEEVVSILRDF